MVRRRKGGNPFRSKALPGFPLQDFRYDDSLRAGFPMRRVARKMVNAPSDAIKLPMTGIVDIDITVSYM
jgi:hypothetical protein